MSNISKIELILKKDLPIGFEYGLSLAPADENDLFKEESAYLKSIRSPARKESYILGRAACHQALKKVGLNGPVLRAEDGRPEWPQNITGSLSNKAGFGVAAVTKNPNYLAFGIDLEAQFENTKIAKKIGTQNEIIELNLESDPAILTKLFSAKEALFKALYPRTRTFFGFLDAELALTPQGFRCLRLEKFPNMSLESIKIRTAATDGLVVSIVWMDKI